MPAANPYSIGVSSGIEYGFYALLIYSTVLSGWIPLGGSIVGGLYAIMAVYCIFCLGSRASRVYVSIAMPLCCAVSFITVQIVVHGEPFAAIRSFIVWMLHLVIMRTLCLRPRFLHRFAFVALIIGVSLAPFLYYSGAEDAVTKQYGLDLSFTMANTNDISRVFGFLSVYFIVAGLTTKRMGVRIASWLIVSGGLFVIGITGSRGNLIAVLVAVIVALRRSLKRGFLPLLSLCLVLCVSYEFGFFDYGIKLYSARAGQLTGRELAWPIAARRFLQSPLAGVGVSNYATYVPSIQKDLTPHNAFLTFALTGGVIPLVFFVGTWLLAARKVFLANARKLPDASFLLPLFFYTILAITPENTSFMLFWAVAVTCATLSSDGMQVVEGRTALRRGALTAGMRMRQGSDRYSRHYENHTWTNSPKRRSGTRTS